MENTNNNQPQSTPPENQNQPQPSPKTEETPTENQAQNLDQEKTTLPTQNQENPEIPATEQKTKSEKQEGIGKKIDDLAANLDKQISLLPISGYGLAGTICGIIALIFCVSGFFIPALPIGMVGIAFAILAKFNKNDDTGFYIALTFNGMALLLFIFIWIFFYRGIGAMRA